ncbi:hypothetical protein [Ilumatobacter nonamiensis]|uniref:hypothetical protein n=1 Tax=Ilumatobacter nonamiensis TaxID=467093 RepID=UPI00058B3764|nr:hypothetical protein [Ilumatobacter nonamiensis]
MTVSDERDQLQSGACSDDYLTPAEEPCVPGGGDIDCSDLVQWGVGHVEVVGEDVYAMDNDQDGIACESNIPQQPLRSVKRSRAWRLSVSRSP